MNTRIGLALRSLLRKMCHFDRMTRGELETLWGIFRGKPWETRKLLKEFLERATIDIDEEILKRGETGKIDDFEIYKPGEPLLKKNVATGIVEPPRTLLNGKELPDYPQFSGPVIF